MKYLLFAIIMVIIGCSSKEDKPQIEKVYEVKVVFTDNHEDNIRIKSVCPPKLSSNPCSDIVYLTINCDWNDKVASNVKYFSILNEK